MDALKQATVFRVIALAIGITAFAAGLISPMVAPEKVPTTISTDLAVFGLLFLVASICIVYICVRIAEVCYGVSGRKRPPLLQRAGMLYVCSLLGFGIIERHIPGAFRISTIIGYLAVTLVMFIGAGRIVRLLPAKSEQARAAGK